MDLKTCLEKSWGFIGYVTSNSAQKRRLSSQSHHAIFNFPPNTITSSSYFYKVKRSPYAHSVPLKCSIELRTAQPSQTFQFLILKIRQSTFLNYKISV